MISTTDQAEILMHNNTFTSVGLDQNLSVFPQEHNKEHKNCENYKASCEPEKDPEADLKGNLSERPVKFIYSRKDMAETYKRPSVIWIDFANLHVFIAIFCKEEFDVREFLKSSHNTTLTWLHGEKLVKFIRSFVGSSRFIVNMDAKLAV
ncbi:hypothetical protein C5167_026231 [Papaver somniferum]|nr:hypothetical protein C5167_026231 [Papaver somniferum]